MFCLEPPIRITAEPYFALPAAYTVARHSAWSDAQLGGRALGSFLEGPDFDRDGNLFVVDIPFGRIFRIEPDGRSSVWASYEGWPSGLKVLGDGRLLIADHRMGLVAIDPDGRASVIADGYRGERFRGLNDLTLGRDGWVYFTDQGQSGLQDPVGAVYRWHRITNRLERVMSGIPSPNGLVLNADESRLFVAVTRANAIWRLPFVKDGGVSKAGVFLNLSAGNGPDGLALDVEDGLVVAQPGLGVLRFDKVGVLTHFIDVPAAASPSNVVFGGFENKELFITDSSSSRILRARMPVAGHVREER